MVWGPAELGVALGEGVAVALGALSTGNPSPGLSARVEFFAYAFWIARVCVAF